MTRSETPEPALYAGDDPRRYAELLTEVYDATMSGDKAPARPREVIDDSWNRLLAQGADPDRMNRASPSVTVGDLELRRQESGLADVVDDLARGLESVITDGDNILVIADRGGRVLWRSGSNRVLTNADRLGFVEGADWAEDAVGTNAIGTALASGRALQVFSAEHFVRSHHTWTCAGAPIRDARTNEVIGVVDVSGPAATIHPTTVALVDAVARLAESHLRELHRRNLDRLRSVAAPMLARLAGRALAVDAHGWVAAVESVADRNRILLPDDLRPGRVWLPSLGSCDMEPLPGGWLVRVGADAGAASDVPTTVVVDLRDGSAPSVRVDTALGGWTNAPTPRHAEILYLLARHRAGRTAAQMAHDLFGDESRVITVRAEMSRLRRQLAGVVVGNPYRFLDDADVQLMLPLDTARLLPHSVAPAVCRARVA